MTNKMLAANAMLEEGVNFILTERYDLSKNSLKSQVTRLAKKSQYTLDHWLGVCKRCALVGDPMPWEDM